MSHYSSTYSLDISSCPPATPVCWTGAPPALSWRGRRRCVGLTGTPTPPSASCSGQPAGGTGTSAWCPWGAVRASARVSTQVCCYLTMLDDLLITMQSQVCSLLRDHSGPPTRGAAYKISSGATECHNSRGKIERKSEAAVDRGDVIKPILNRITNNYHFQIQRLYCLCGVQALV